MKISDVFILIILFHATPAYAVESWQNQSRIAHVLLEENRIPESLQKFDQAIQSLHNTNGDTATTIDLELNKVYVLTLSGRLNEAQELLNRVEPSVMQLKNKTLEIRYYRRLSRLRAAQKNFESSLEIRIRNLKLISTVCGRNNSTYVNELHGVMTTALDAKLWKLSVKPATELREIQKACGNPSNKRLLSAWLGDYFNRSLRLIQQRIQTGELAEVERFAQTFGEYANSTGRTELWIAIFNAAVEQHQVALANQCKTQLQSDANNGKLTFYDMNTIASAYLRIALKDVYNEKVRESTELLLDSACRILESVKKQDVLQNNLLYIQCKSLYALALANRNKITESQAVLDTLKPSPELITDTQLLNGMTQTRVVIARYYVSRGDKSAAHDQFEKQYRLYQMMTKAKRRDLDEKYLRLYEQKTIH